MSEVHVSRTCCQPPTWSAVEPPALRNAPHSGPAAPSWLQGRAAVLLYVDDVRVGRLNLSLGIPLLADCGFGERIGALEREVSLIFQRK